MRRLARWTLQQLQRTRFFAARPQLAPLLRTLWRYARARTPEARAAALQALSLGTGRRYPILFRDRHGLEYLLYPDQNAEVYLANNGNYEIGETEFCLQHVAPGSVVFDVGANIGLYTLLFAKCAGPEGRVHAFEPEPRNFRRLKINLVINAAENVTPQQAAVTAHSGTATLHVFPDAFHAWHSLQRAVMPAPNQPGETVTPEAALQVTATSLDDYCAAHNIERIDYLKIDVEEAELGVLQGAHGLLSRGAVDVIQFEAWPLPGDPADSTDPVFACLEGHGYRCHPIGPTGSLLPQTHRAQNGYGNYAALR